MMPTSIKNYVRVYEGFFKKSLCDQLVSELSEINWHKHTFYNPKTDSDISYEDDLYVAYHAGPQKDEIQKNLWFAINQYITKDYGFEWLPGWNGYSDVRFNKYPVGTQMKKHCDHIHSLFDGGNKGIPVLTILGSLNDDYEGGELLMWDGEKIELKGGSVMIFPSNFLFPHEVTKVTSGVRYSFVSWAW